MVLAPLEALVGTEASVEDAAAALSTVPAAELPGALRLLAREHGAAAVPLLRACLAGRPEWAVDAADALATVTAPEAALALAAAAPSAAKPVRTAIRRALYRLRQAGITPPPAEAVRSGPPPLRPVTAWMSAIDGTGSRGLWLVLAGPFGERTLLSAALSDETGILEFTAGPVSRKRLDESLAALRADPSLPWVEIPPEWAWSLLVQARDRHRAAGSSPPGDVDRWLARVAPPPAPAGLPIAALVDLAEVQADPRWLERSGEVLARPELAGWFLDPSTVEAEALERLQSRESRLVVSDQVKAERLASFVDQVADRELGPAARTRWAQRLEDTAFVLARTGAGEDARLALAAARALADPGRPARYVPFVRALVERSLEVAGEVTLGRLSRAEASRQPRSVGRAG